MRSLAGSTPLPALASPNKAGFPSLCQIMEKKMETTRFRGYIGFRVWGLGRVVDTPLTRVLKY